MADRIAPQPPNQSGKVKLERAANWLVFIYALLACTMLSAFRVFLRGLSEEPRASSVEESILTRQAAYLPLGCLFAGVLGWLLQSRLNRHPENRLWNALFWAGYCLAGYALAEFVSFGGIDAGTPLRIGFWAATGAVLGLLSTPRRPVIDTSKSDNA